MTNIEKLALDICRMPNSDKVLEALTVLLPMMRRERDGGKAPRPTPPAVPSDGEGGTDA